MAPFLGGTLFTCERSSIEMKWLFLLIITVIIGVRFFGAMDDPFNTENNVVLLIEVAIFAIALYNVTRPRKEDG